MLERTFLHLPGVGYHTERALWDSGIETWADLADALHPDRALLDQRASLIPRLRVGKVFELLEESQRALAAHDAQFFADRLPRRELWRILHDFEGRTVFVDIETTGLSKVYDDLTLVGAYAAGGYDARIAGYNLDDAEELFDSAAVIVTFNGATFDLPFLHHKMPDVAFPPVHIDLRYPLRRAGLSGGLKKIEEQLGWQREASDGLTGRDAVHLWYRYRQGDAEALRALLEYNSEDTSVLIRLARSVYGRLKSSLMGSDNEEEIDVDQGEIDFRPQQDEETILQLLMEASKRGAPRSDFTIQQVLKLIEGTPRVVGIDLTGSEARPSGWALADGNQVRTARVATDEELIAETVAAAPDIVSIDSPLSLPPGTTLDEHGRVAHYDRIHRDSELELRRRGVSVFWTLLPTMQDLSLRGIRLASELRERGLTVIESFPGAAQDVLQLPRKRHGVEELRHALADLGLAGDFVTDAVSHDELDAITSALVGLFFLADRYEALGESDFNDLILPAWSTRH